MPVEPVVLALPVLPAGSCSGCWACGAVLTWPAKPVFPKPHPPSPHSSPPLRAAVRALAASGLAVGMTGAGVVGACNPAEAGYRPLFAAAANGSWLGVVPGEAARG